MTQTNGPGEKKRPARAGNTAGGASGRIEVNHEQCSTARQVRQRGRR